jgi:hypothetical protein
MRNLGENIAPYGGVAPPVIREHDDTSTRHFVDIVTDGSGRIGCSAILHGECPTG